MRKLTIYDWFGMVIPMPEKYRLIKAAGFDGVMTWWGGDDKWGDDYKQNPALARAQGLFVENAHAPFDTVNNLWLDNLESEAYADDLIRYAGELAQIGIPTMIVHVSNGYDPPPVCQLGIDRLKRLTATAETHKINVAVENLRRGDYTAAVFGAISSPYLKFCYDSGHNNYVDRNSNYLGMYGNKLAALHLHDNDGTTDQHLAPMDGTADWPLIARRIKDTGYTGAVALEVFCGEGKLPRDTASELLAYAHERAVRVRELLNGPTATA